VSPTRLSISIEDIAAPNSTQYESDENMNVPLSLSDRSLNLAAYIVGDEHVYYTGDVSSVKHTGEDSFQAEIR
jgi:hypothetical protein